MTSCPPVAMLGLQGYTFGQRTTFPLSRNQSGVTLMPRRAGVGTRAMRKILGLAGMFVGATMMASAGSASADTYNFVYEFNYRTSTDIIFSGILTYEPSSSLTPGQYEITAVSGSMSISGSTLFGNSANVTGLIPTTQPLYVDTASDPFNNIFYKDSTLHLDRAGVAFNLTTATGLVLQAVLWAPDPAQYPTRYDMQFLDADGIVWYDWGKPLAVATPLPAALPLFARRARRHGPDLAPQTQAPRRSPRPDKLRLFDHTGIAAARAAGSVGLVAVDLTAQKFLPAA